MPKFTALALLRIWRVTSSTGTWNTWEAVIRWMSVPGGRPDHVVVPDGGQDPQLDLGVVGVHQGTLLRHEELPHLRPQSGADGDVLDVGLRGADAGRCAVSVWIKVVWMRPSAPTTFNSPST